MRVNNLWKIFCAIINKRLQNFPKDHKILEKSLVTDKHVNKNQSKVFACFVDFEKVFDSEIGHPAFKCLLFADDLVILSKTKEGLKQLLDIIDAFSQTRALKINFAKI